MTEVFIWVKTLVCLWFKRRQPRSSFHRILVW